MMGCVQLRTTTPYKDRKDHVCLQLMLLIYVSTLSLQIRELQTYHPIPLLFDFKNAVTL